MEDCRAKYDYESMRSEEKGKGNGNGNGKGIPSSTPIETG